MEQHLFMAGFGGQGILLIGNLLAYAGILEGKHVCYFPSYGVEKRGGAATCTVSIGDTPIGSPVVGNPETTLLLNQTAYERYLPRMRAGGFCLLNSSLVEEQGTRTDVEILRLPLNEMALKVGDPRLVNMISIGVYARKTGAVSLDSLKAALRHVLPERNHRFIPLNVEAIDLGAGSVVA